jgi:hypothetical protein
MRTIPQFEGSVRRETVRVLDRAYGHSLERAAASRRNPLRGDRLGSETEAVVAGDHEVRPDAVVNASGWE